MIRRFKFEDEVHQNLSCVPMAARRKLDQAGIKISLQQWQKLGRGERLAVCHLPVGSSDECDAFRVFIDEALANHNAGESKVLPEHVRAAAEAPSSPPPTLIENARADGVAISQSDWDRLDQDERYALIKLGGGTERSHNFRSALAEFFSR